MTKRTATFSLQGAFRRSVDALGPDAEGQTDWHRLSAQFRVPIRTLYNAADPEPASNRTPIRQEWLEWLDLTNVREGTGRAINREAWQARHDAAIDGRELPEITPEFHIEIAVGELEVATADYQRGMGDVSLIRERLARLQVVAAGLFAAWSDGVSTRASEASHRDLQHARERAQRKEDRDQAGTFPIVAAGATDDE